MSFLRRQNPSRRRIDQTLATRNRRRLRQVLLVMPLAVTAYLLFTGDSGLPRLRIQDGRIQDLEREIAGLEADNASLREETALLKTDLKTIERIARERYGMVRKNESVYMVYPAEDKP